MTIDHRRGIWIRRSSQIAVRLGLLTNKEGGAVPFSPSRATALPQAIICGLMYRLRGESVEYPAPRSGSRFGRHSANFVIPGAPERKAAESGNIPVTMSGEH